MRALFPLMIQASAWIYGREDTEQDERKRPIALKRRFNEQSGQVAVCARKLHTARKPEAPIIGQAGCLASPCPPAGFLRPGCCRGRIALRNTTCEEKAEHHFHGIS